LHENQLFLLLLLLILVVLIRRWAFRRSRVHEGHVDHVSLQEVIPWETTSKDGVTPAFKHILLGCRWIIVSRPRVLQLLLVMSLGIPRNFRFESHISFIERKRLNLFDASSGSVVIQGRN